jgi:hypothetical protein
MNGNQVSPSDASLAEAFKELGRLRLENAELKDKEERRSHWLDEAKERAGYHYNTSFDVVFEELLEFANEAKRQRDEQTTTK